MINLGSTVPSACVKMVYDSFNKNGAHKDEIYVLSYKCDTIFR